MPTAPRNPGSYSNPNVRIPDRDTGDPLGEHLTYVQ
jgi:hypothetical protein